MTGSAGFRLCLQALRFDVPLSDGLDRIDETALRWCDRTQMTLELARRCGDALPERLRTRLESNLRANRERTRRLESLLAGILALLARHGLDPVLLKGFAHTPDFGGDSVFRPQYDFDLWLPLDQAREAQHALAALGYEPLERMGRYPTDHLPVLIRKTGYQWRGDFFDPDIPPSVDLHYRLWDRDTEGFDAPGWERFGDRAARRLWNGVEFSALETADALGYAALHALRHLLRGSLRVYHVYEIASFLDARAADGEFWMRWRAQHGDALRRLEVILLALAHAWFGCRLHAVVQEQVASLPPGARAWLDRYGESPIDGLFRPNKHELWLHLELVESSKDARRVLVRRLLPARIPGPADSSVLLPDSQVTWRVRARREWRRGVRILERSWHHASVLPSVAVHGLGWWFQRSGIEPGFLRYLATSCTFCAGVFVFFVLYNLHLLGLGFREDFLGQVSAAMTVGSIAGTLPADWLVRRLGLRATILGSIAGIAVVSAMRAIFVSPALLLATAFGEGVLLGGWAVQAMPAVAQLTTPQGRARAFSLFAASGISMGVIGGMLGGRLPGWIMQVRAGAGADQARYAAILVGCAIVALALVPARGLRFAKTAEPAARSYPSSRFVIRFLGALAVWHFATGAFKPFFNAWLARHVGAAVETIGAVFSAGQLTQVLALLAAPAVLRRMGVIGGVSAMLSLTGLCLASSSLASTVPAAAAGYVAYMAAQYMSEPGMFTLLMNRVPAAQHSGASAMNFLTVYATHAIAALAAGAAYAHYGYPPVMLAAGTVALLGGCLFWRLLRGLED